jgi:enoyl-CoA hydratase/carnithine racemase
VTAPHTRHPAQGLRGSGRGTSALGDRTLSSEWIDAPTAVRSGLAWRDVDDDRLLVEALTASTSNAEHDPSSVIAAKRLMTAGRDAVARAAIGRELDEMRLLFGPGRPEIG